MVDDRKRGHARGDEEGVEIGRRVRLPRGAEPPISVYINGIQQVEGEDYKLDAGGIWFKEPIVKEGKLGGLRWLSMYIGLFGTYRKNETVDVEFRRSGKVELAANLEVTKD